MDKEIKLTAEQLKQWIELEDEEFYLDKLREKRSIHPDSSVFHTTISRMVDEKELRRVGRGLYHKIKKAIPIKVFSVPRERVPPFNLIFPKDFNTGMEMDFAESVVMREGDLITLGGVKSKGKTTLCLLFCAENIDKNPVLMGNEYTTKVENENVPTARFYDRLDRMSKWLQWTDDEGNDRFQLLAVKEDYAEQIVQDRINIIDWINLDANALYDIGKVLGSIKANLGRGIAIVALQKSESSDNPRGGQFVRDYSDLELLLDGFGECEDDILLTIKGAKEKTKPIVGKTYAYTIIEGGTQITNFREVKKCPACFGRGFGKSGQCDICFGKKFIDK